jgi:hypothetical protein
MVEIRMTKIATDQIERRRLPAAIRRGAGARLGKAPCGATHGTVGGLRK